MKNGQRIKNSQRFLEYHRFLFSLFYNKNWRDGWNTSYWPWCLSIAMWWDVKNHVVLQDKHWNVALKKKKHQLQPMGNSRSSNKKIVLNYRNAKNKRMLILVELFRFWKLKKSTDFLLESPYYSENDICQATTVNGKHFRSVITYSFWSELHYQNTKDIWTFTKPPLPMASTFGRWLLTPFGINSIIRIKTICGH